jgi:hypothetical protein
MFTCIFQSEVCRVRSPSDGPEQRVDLLDGRAFVGHDGQATVAGLGNADDL